MIGLNYLGKLGQLGNQMFQYAALMGIADKLGTSFTIPNHNEVVEDGLGNKLRIGMITLAAVKRLFLTSRIRLKSSSLSKMTLWRTVRRW